MAKSKSKSKANPKPRKPRAAKAAPIVAPPKRRGRPAVELPDYSGVKCPADPRAYEYAVPVKFGSSVSSRGQGTKGTRVIGVTVRRGEFDASKAAKVFVGTALSCLLRGSPGSHADAVGQQTMGEIANVEVCAVAQSSRLTESAKKFSASLCVDKQYVSSESLERLVGLDGTLYCTVIEEKSKDDSEGE